MPSVYLLNLGCAKNLVDSELILGKLRKAEFTIKDQPENVDLAIINTCSFIKEAKEESIEAILELVELKKIGEVRKIVVAGCLTQRYKDELRNNLKEVDGFLGVEAWRYLGGLLKILLKGYGYPFGSISDTLSGYAQGRFMLTPAHYAYIKIAEGCDNFCSYCSISQIRGRLRSRSIESIEEEVDNLAGGGNLKEINLIAQDTTMYGYDLYGEVRLVDLLKKLEKIGNIAWVRLLYTHPAHFSEELIKLIGGSSKICKYIDLPLQHISESILSRMRRKITKKEIYALIAAIRKEIPDVALRTTFIVGFPGERDKDFNELIEFIKQIRFEHLGAFIYSPEENTRAFTFREQIPEKVKQERLEYLLKEQEEISAGILRGYVGKILPLLIDEKLAEDKHTFLARTEFEAPEVDGTVILKDGTLCCGQLIRAEITDTWEYDLIARRI